MPEDLWVYDVSTAESVQLTHSLHGDVRREDTTEPALVRYPSKDGKLSIPAWVYVPYNLVRDATNPAVVLVHGGPAAQAVNDFNRPVQALVSHGYVVIVPNYRGSRGYGKAFEDANYLDMGGGDLEDVLSAAEFVVQTGYVAPAEIGIMGTSYGGYLTLLAATKAPERFAAAVALFPFVNWFTEVENEDPVIRAYDLAKMGDPVENRALWGGPLANLLRRSHAGRPPADRWRARTGGAHPPEARRMVQALEKNGKHAEIEIYENEGHGFGRIENQIDAHRRVLEFLRRHLPTRARGLP